MSLCIAAVPCTRAAILSAVVNVALFGAVIGGLTLPAERARAESPSVTILASDYHARAQTDYAGLYARIGRAAAQLCDSFRYATGTRIDRAYRKCVADTVTETVARVKDESLSAYHRRQGAGTAAARIAATTTTGSE